MLRSKKQFNVIGVYSFLLHIFLLHTLVNIFLSFYAYFHLFKKFSPFFTDHRSLFRPPVELTNFIFTGSNFRKFREFWVISRKFIPAKYLAKTNSRKIILAKKNYIAKFPNFFGTSDEEDIKTLFCMLNVSFALKISFTN